jgi:PAS domain S-box-containing protein
VSAYRVEGEVKFIIAVYEDITERKRAEEETQLLLTLSTDLQNARTAQDALNLGMVNLAMHGKWDYGEIWWADLDGQLRYCDCYYIAASDLKEFHQRSKEMVTDLPPDYRYGWDENGVHIDWHKELAEFTEFGRRDLALQHGLQTMVSVGLQENGQQLGVMMFMKRRTKETDEHELRLFRASGAQLISVIQRKLAEAAQKESEARFRAITETAFEGIVIHRDGNILDVNPAFARLLGHAPEEILKMPLVDLVYEDDPEKWLKKVSGKSGGSVEFTGRKANGDAIFLEAVSRRDTWLGNPANILAVRDITGQKLVEEAREAARIDARFRAYVQNSSEIIQILDLEGMITYCSPSMKRIAGYSPDEMVGRHYLDLCHEEDRERFSTVQQRVAREPGSTAQVQARIRHTSGVWREIQTSLVNLMDDPLVRGVLLSSRDITDVIAAQRSMTESEERFRTLFAHSPDAIFVESRAGYVLDVNEAGCALHEMTRDEIIGKHVTELSPESNYDRVMESFSRLFTSKFESVEGKSVTRNGKVIPVEVRVNVIQFQNEEAIILQVRDITERKKSELVLKESEERFRALVEFATEAIFVIDLDTDTFIEANKNAEKLFGRSRDALMSTPPWELSPEKQPDGSNSRELQRSFLEKAAQGERVVYEWVHLNSVGQAIDCEVRLNRFPSSTDVLIRGSVTDITERKLAEQRILQSQERLRVQNEMLIDLAASTAINSGDLQRAYREITRGICETMRVDEAGVWLFDDETTVLTCQMCYDARSGQFEQGQTFSAEKLQKYMEAIRVERVIAATDTRSDVRTTQLSASWFDPRNIHSAIEAPLRHHGRIAGVVRIGTVVARQEWSPESQSFAASMADMVTLSLEAWERKKAEQELAKTLSKMRATFDSTRDGILVVDNNGYVLEYNQGFVELSNIPQEILDSGEPSPGFSIMVEQVVNPEAFTLAMQQMESHPENEERHIYSLYDGRVIEVYVRPMMLGNEAQGRLWFLHDITELKRAETALLESETKFRSLFSQANDAILVMEGDKISEYNDKALEMFGLSGEQITGKAFYHLSPPTQASGIASDVGIWEHLNEVLQGESVSFNWKHQRSDGSPFDAEVSLNQVRIGPKTYVQAFVRDITERKRAESALRESERKNKAILDAIPDLMLRISAEGRVIDYKISDQQTLLITSKRLLDRNLDDILPGPMAEKALLHMQKALQSGEGQQYESEMRYGDETKDYETRLVRSGTTEVLIIIRDVTERKRTEKELIKRNFELDSFVYRASHDLKAPLNSLMGLIDLLENETADTGILGYLGMMNKSVVKLDTFIRDLADFSRNARQELQTTVINWQAMIKESIENLQFMEHATRVDKQVSITASADFYSDPVRIGIVLNNLISNAVKYQDLKKEQSFVRIEVESDAKQAVIRVIDNGIGIPARYHEKIFTLFFRASIQSYGSGMGMYIVKNAIEKLRGAIRLESQEEEGSTFTVVLPGNPADQPDA